MGLHVLQRRRYPGELPGIMGHDIVDQGTHLRVRGIDLPVPLDIVPGEKTPRMAAQKIGERGVTIGDRLVETFLELVGGAIHEVRG
eukprot:Nk52_evm1s2230 gene=Nk52_evmTU1s2230